MQARNRVAYIGLVLLAACTPSAGGSGSGPTERPQKVPESAPEPTPDRNATVNPLPAGHATNLCGSEVESEVRTHLTTLPSCNHTPTLTYVRVNIRGHDIIAVAWLETRHTVLAGVARPASSLLIDGARPQAKPWAGIPLDGLPVGEAQVFLEAVMLHSAAGEVTYRVAPTPVLPNPGFIAKRGHYQLRGYSSHSEFERGHACSFTHRHDIVLTRNGELIVYPRQTWADGTKRGRPCGVPLPRKLPPSKGDK